MHINQLKESKFLKKEDCGKGILVTIAGIIQENVAGKDEQEDLRFCLTFVEEQVKPMVLNQTNINLIAKITGSDDTDGWTGHQIVCYNDPAISFAGRITGGIRVRAPKRVVVPAAKPAPAPAVSRPAPARPAPLPPMDPGPDPALVEEDEDEVPF